MEVGIRDLKNNLSRHLEEVKRGATIVVTDRGTPVAKIEPIGEMTNFERMCAEGKITPALREKRPGDYVPDPVDVGLSPEEIRRAIDWACGRDQY